MLGRDVKTIHRWAMSGRLEPFTKLDGETGAFVFERSEVERVQAVLLAEAHERVKALTGQKVGVAAVALLALLAGPTVSTDGHPPLAPSSTDGHRGLDLDAVSQ